MVEMEDEPLYLDDDSIRMGWIDRNRGQITKYSLEILLTIAISAGASLYMEWNLRHKPSADPTYVELNASQTRKVLEDIQYELADPNYRRDGVVGAHVVDKTTPSERVNNIARRYEVTFWFKSGERVVFKVQDGPPSLDGILDDGDVTAERVDARSKDHLGDVAQRLYALVSREYFK
jgi:hypothetical protein